MIRALWALFMLVVCAPAVHAVVLSGPTSSGKVVFTPDEVRVLTGCPSSLQERLEDGVVIPMAAICDSASWTATSRPAATCQGRTMAVLGVRFRGSDALVLAEGLVIDDRYFHVWLLTTLEDAHGPGAQVEEVTRIKWCTETGNSTSEEVALPRDSCREPRQFAAAFDYGTPLSNKILTNGFSFFVRMVGETPADFDVAGALDDVRSSFGTALTIWMSALQDNDDLLSPAVRAFTAGRTYKSEGGYSMLLPPQVIRMYCPHAATFIVEFNFGDDNTFTTAPGTLMLARARLEGRTIALNLRDVDCFKPMLRFDTLKKLALRDDRCVNLLPVLAHELGHAFGMDHIPTASGTALMNSQLSKSTSVPTRLDVKALVAALERSVVGAAPGALEFRSSEGLLAPKDWTPTSRAPVPPAAISPHRTMPQVR